MAKLSLNDRTFAIVAVRWLLGIQSLGSGINWWIKILPFPNMHEPLVGPVKHEILRTLIESGWMFSTAKVIEIILGLALIFNRHAVLALVLSFPVILMTFLLDLWPFTANVVPFVSGNLSFAALWASFLDMLFFGGGVFVMQAYLMSEYFDDYRSLFVVKPGGTAPGWSSVLEAGWFKATLRWLSYTVGALSTLWVITMALHIVPWSSLAIMAPPH
jgi:hypothetical protein